MEWREFIQQYFQAVHQSSMDGMYERLLPFYCTEESGVQDEWNRLNREKRRAEERGVKLLAVQGQVTPMCWVDTDATMEITVQWQENKTLGIKQTKYKEANKRLFQLQLLKTNEKWSIIGARESNGDQKLVVEEEEEEPIIVVSGVEDAIDQPMLIVHGAGGYNAANAVAYAERYWNTTNPVYPRFTDDCTNFISQCLHAGGIPMLMSKEMGKGWWIRTGKGASWSYSWTVAHSLYLLLKSGGAPMRAVTKSSAAELVPGDIICYDFNGDGRFQHNTIVVAKDANQMPLVNAHTTDSSMRYWAYEDSTAYTPNMRYAFFHIRGV
ncbi:amidase domain-containing protein [Brevibacillus brevis]|uniref:amidase domain-containing protein n=1 Tax=Brevibacillus brevis TaxID=1393 RepID=UPI00165E1D81